MLQFTTAFPKKRAFITGAGSGLGQAFAYELAKEGWTIGVADVNEAPLLVTKTSIEKLGGKAFPYVFDVRYRAAYAKVAEDFLLNNQGIDLLINNAGVGGGGPFEQYSLEDWDWMVGINLMGVVNGNLFFVKEFQKQKSGYIINIASAAGFANAPNMGAYSATKAAVISLSEVLKYELKPYNVGVSAVMPTFFKTNIMNNARMVGNDGAIAQKLIDRSNLEASTVALEILTKAGKGKHKIVLPNEARIQYFLKRFFPKFFEKAMLKGLEGHAKKHGK